MFALSRICPPGGLRWSEKLPLAEILHGLTADVRDASTLPLPPRRHGTTKRSSWSSFSDRACAHGWLLDATLWPMDGRGQLRRSFSPHAKPGCEDHATCLSPSCSPEPPWQARDSNAFLSMHCLVDFGYSYPATCFVSVCWMRSKFFYRNFYFQGALKTEGNMPERQ
jgi:hypothetical protein